MRDRSELNTLVLMTIKSMSFKPKASEIYDCLKSTHPDILRDERVRGFKSFTRIMGSFAGISKHGTGTFKYAVKPSFRNL